VESFCRGSHIHQQRVLQRFDELVDSGTSDSHYFILEWARRHRKTTLAINLLIREACRLPQSKFVYVAPTKVMARNIVWDDPQMMRAYLPDKREMDYTLNDQKMMVKFANGSVVQCGGSDDPDSLRGIDAIGVVLDEYSLHKPEVWSEIFRPIIAGPIPPHLSRKQVYRWAMFLYTPQPGGFHATQLFDEAACIGEGGTLPEAGVAPKMKPRWYASRLNAERVGLIPDSELQAMREDPMIPDSLYRQEMLCERVTTEEMTLITSAMLSDLNQHHATTHTAMQEIRKIVSCDPAFGGDVCKIMGMINCTIEAEESIHNRHDTAEVVMAIKTMASRIGTKNIITDMIGAGLGIYHALQRDEADYAVQGFNSAESPTVLEKDRYARQLIQFANKRAEAYWYTAERIRKFLVGPIRNPELLRQLPTASRYTTQGNSGRMLIIKKEKIKEVLKCSPDEADCYVMGIWGSQFVEPEEGPNIIRFGAEASMLPDFVGV